MSIVHLNRVTEQNIKRTVETLSKDKIFIEHCNKLNISEKDYDLLIRECLDKTFSVFDRLLKQGVYSVRIHRFGIFTVKEKALIIHFRRIMAYLIKTFKDLNYYKLYINAFYYQFKLIDYYKPLRKNKNSHESNHLWKYMQEFYECISFNYRSK